MTMLEHLADSDAAAVAIETVTKANLEEWKAAHPDRAEWLRATGFAADPGAFTFLPPHDGAAPRVLAAPCDENPVWSLAGLPTALPEGAYRLNERLSSAAATDAALGWALGGYAFSKYKTPKRKAARLVWPEEADRSEVERIANAVFHARDLINTPAEDLGPDDLVEAGARIAKDGGAEARIIRGDDLLRENFPAVHAVGRASARPPALLDFRWGDESAPKVTLVGKGVCFDTGGLDLKTADGMLHMKKDMGGAAVVLSLAKTLMAGQAPIRLRVLVPAVENSVSGNAIRPMDIIRTRYRAPWIHP